MKAAFFRGVQKNTGQAPAGVPGVSSEKKNFPVLLTRQLREVQKRGKNKKEFCTIRPLYALIIQVEYKKCYGVIVK